MKQRIIQLQNDGTVGLKRMQPYTPSDAQKRPGISLSRIQQLLQSHKPKICVVRGEGIGDVIMTTPVVHELKTMFDNVEITYATNTAYLNGAIVKVLMYNPDIDNIIERDLMNPADYDLVINLHCPCIHYEVPGNPPVNRIDLFAKHINLHLNDTQVRYFVQKEEIEAGKEFLRLVLGRNKLVMVQPFASNKRRSFEHMRLKKAIMTLYQTHKIKSVIVTHSGDFQSDTLWDNIPGSIILHNADIRTIAAVMVHCDMLLCPDSSLLHLGGALQMPTVSLFGPTHPDARINYYPYATAIWEGRHLQPCPCWYSTCPIGETCWKQITSEMIVTEVLQRLQSSKKIDTLQLLNRNTAIEIKAELV